MKIEEIHIKEIDEKIEIADHVVLTITAKIQNNELRDIRVTERGHTGELPLIPGYLYSEHNWEYLGKLTEFLNEVLKLWKK